MNYQSITSKFNSKPWVVSTVCIMIAGISFGFGVYLLPMVIPEMATDLQLNYTLIGIITGVGQVSTILSIPLAGFLTGRIGGLKLLVGIQLIGGLFLLGLYFVSGFFSFLIFNFLIRAWPIMTWIPLVSIAVEHIPYKWRATMLIIASGATCFFVFIDGLISSFFLEYFHWRTMWLAVAAICLISSLLSWIALKSVGSWQVTVCRHDQERNQSRSELIVWLKSSSGIILNVIFMLTGLSFMTFQVYLASYLRDGLNVGLDTIALMWSSMGISGIFGGIFFGLITDRIGVRISQFFIFAFGIIATFLMCFSVSPLYLIMMAILFGISQATIYGMGPAYISKVLSGESARNAFIIGSMIMSFGGLFGNFIVGWSHGIFGTFWWSYVAIGVIFAFGALLSLLLVSEKRHHLGSSL